MPVPFVVSGYCVGPSMPHTALGGVLWFLGFISLFWDIYYVNITNIIQ